MATLHILLAAFLPLAVMAGTVVIEMYLGVRENCLEKFPMTEAESVDLWRRKLPASEEGKCYLRCCMESMGMVKDNSVVATYPKIIVGWLYRKKKGERDEALKAVDDCAAAVGTTDSCDIATDFASCYLKVAKEIPLYRIMEKMADVRTKCEITEEDTLNFVLKKEVQSEKQKCQVACIMEQWGLMNGDAVSCEAVKEVTNRLLGTHHHHQEVLQAVDTCCSAGSEGERCSNAVSFLECVYAKGPEVAYTEME